MKKKTISFIFKYLGPNDETVSRNLSTTPTLSIKEIREQIQKSFPFFIDREIVLVHHNQILKDDLTIEQLSQQGDLIILVLPKVVSINIIFGKENPKKIDIDITLPMKNVIECFFRNHKLRKKADLISRYVLAYEKTLYPEITEKELKKKKLKQKKKKNTIKFQACCPDLPIYTYKWWYSNFHLIRRLFLEDSQIKNEEERRFLIGQSLISSISCLSAYKSEDWVEFISYQILFQTNDTCPTKEKIESFSPPFIDCSLKQIQFKLKEISSDSLIDAQNKYIEQSIERGCQCAYIENIKMKWMRFWYKYKICVSSMNVMIFSANGKTFQYINKISNIDHIELQGINIYSNFDQDISKEDNKHADPEPQKSESEININLESNSNIDENPNENNSDDKLSNDNPNNISNTNKNIFHSDSNNNFFSSLINNRNNSIYNNVDDNNNENALGITIYFKDNTSWEMCGDSQAAVSRLKVVLDQMIVLNHTMLHDEKSLLMLKEDDTETDDSLKNILGEKIGIFNPIEDGFDNSSRNSFIQDLPKQNTSYPHYSIIITPDEIDNQIIFKGYEGYNKGKDFDFLKENIQEILVFNNEYERNDDDNLPVNNNDPLLVNFFAFCPAEKRRRNIFILILSVLTIINLYQHFKK